MRKCDFMAVDTNFSFVTCEREGRWFEDGSPYRVLCDHHRRQIDERRRRQNQVRRRRGEPQVVPRLWHYVPAED